MGSQPRGRQGRLAKRFGTDVTEESMGDAAFGVTSEGKPSWARSLAQLRCELHSSSSVAQKLLADLLLDEGDHAAALKAYRAAEKLIAAGANPPASQRVRKMIADGLKKAEGK